jgi:hypothetical protein
LFIDIQYLRLCNLSLDIKIRYTNHFNVIKNCNKKLKRFFIIKVFITTRAVVSDGYGDTTRSGGWSVY